MDSQPKLSSSTHTNSKTPLLSDHTSAKFVAGENDNNNSSSGRPAKHPCFKCGQAVNTVATAFKHKKSNKTTPKSRNPDNVYNPGQKCSVKYCKTYWHDKCFDEETCPQIEDEFVLVDDVFME